MQINVLRKMEYGKYIIYVMNFGIIFQYLFADKKGNIYQDYISLKPTLLNSIKYKLNLIATPFIGEELEYGEQVILSGAMVSVDALEALTEKETKHNNKEKGILSPIQMENIQ